MNFETISTGCLNDEDTPWIPFTPYSDEVELKYFKIDPVQGEVIVLLKSPPGAELARHHHTGTVIVYTVQGAWKYKEHDWVARAGSLVYETAASRHTPEALPGTEDVIALNIVKGELVYMGSTTTIFLPSRTWKTSMARYLDYCGANGIVAERPHQLRGLTRLAAEARRPAHRPASLSQDRVHVAGGKDGTQDRRGLYRSDATPCSLFP